MQVIREAGDKTWDEMLPDLIAPSDDGIKAILQKVGINPEIYTMVMEESHNGILSPEFTDHFQHAVFIIDQLREKRVLPNAPDLAPIILPFILALTKTQEKMVDMVLDLALRDFGKYMKDKKRDRMMETPEGIKQELKKHDCAKCPKNGKCVIQPLKETMEEQLKAEGAIPR